MTKDCLKIPSILKKIELNPAGQLYKGTYLLVLYLRRNQKIKIGKHPDTIFAQGVYLYVGRAKKELRGRLNRHLSKKKKLFWHIDYLLETAEIKEIWVKKRILDECQTVISLKNSLNASLPPWARFGSSDCKCSSHLFDISGCVQDLPSLAKKLNFERIEIRGNQV
jgi:sugar fermentation stimulation protein A